MSMDTRSVSGRQGLYALCICIEELCNHAKANTFQRRDTNADLCQDDEITKPPCTSLPHPQPMAQRDSLLYDSVRVMSLISSRARQSYVCTSESTLPSYYGEHQ